LTICKAHGGSASWSKNGDIIFAVWGPEDPEGIELISEKRRSETRGNRQAWLALLACFSS